MNAKVIFQIMEIIMVITQSLPPDVRLRYEQLNQDVSEYSIIGALSLKTLPSIINFSLISGSVVFAPFISISFRKQVILEIGFSNFLHYTLSFELKTFIFSKILSRINSQLDKSSQVKKSQNRVFVKVRERAKS